MPFTDGGALAGVAFSLGWSDAPRPLVAAHYVALIGCVVPEAGA